MCSIDNCQAPVHARRLCDTHYMRWLRYGDPHFVHRIINNDGKRFWSQVDKQKECWVWTGCLYPTGYGLLRLQNRGVAAHRYSFFLHNGHWPKPFCLHSCDNRKCVNPSHLREGTHQSNMADMVARKRSPQNKGSRNPNAKLTEADIMTIKARTRDGETFVAVAKDYGVKDTCISRIHNEKSWTHVH